jgi:hypothetical protein
MEIYIYDTGANGRGLVGIIDHYNNLRTVTRYDSIGEFELVSPALATIELLKPDRYLWVQGAREIYIIEAVTIKELEEGLMITSRGRTATSLLSRRAVPDIAKYTGTHGAVASSVLNKILSDSLRTFGGFINNINIALGENIQYQTDCATLLDILQMLALDAGLGFRTVFDPLTLTLSFEYYHGIDRTTLQGGNVKFDTAYENLFNTEFIDSIENYANVLYVLGETNSSTGVPKKAVYDAGKQDTGLDTKGYDRFETIVNYSTPSTTDGAGTSITGGNLIGGGSTQEQLTTAQYNQAMLDFAKGQSATFARAISQRGDMDINSKIFKYKTDWDIGDIVTIKDSRLGISTVERVTEIEESYDGGIKTINITVGDFLPTLSDKIKHIKVNGGKK